MKLLNKIKEFIEHRIHMEVIYSEYKYRKDIKKKRSIEKTEEKCADLSADFKQAYFE